MSKMKENSTWKKAKVPCGKHHNETGTKTTVSLYLSKNLVEKARERGLNLSRITERALTSIIDYLETENVETSSKFLGRPSFQEEGSVVPRARFEPATTRSSAGCSPRLSYLGASQT